MNLSPEASISQEPETDLPKALQELAKQFDYDVTRPRVRPDVSKFVAALQSCPFQLAMVVGFSGSGKSTLLKALAQENCAKPFVFMPTFDKTFGDKNKIEDFDTGSSMDESKVPLVSHFASTGEAVSRLCMCGIASVPHWFAPFGELSDGEKARFVLAKGIRSHVLIDEFTTNLDRLTARAVCHNLQKCVRKKAELQNIVLAGVHRDIIPWVQPDLLIDLDQKCIVAKEAIPRPPRQEWIPIILAKPQPMSLRHIDERVVMLSPCNKDVWPQFAPYHYLSANLNDAARCWVAQVLLDQQVVSLGFVATLSHPSGTLQNAYREHRLVVLPQLQGCGLGTVLSDCVADYHVHELGHRYFSRTFHPGLGRWRNASSKWRETGTNEKVNKIENDGNIWVVSQRRGFSHEYMHNAMRAVSAPLESNFRVMPAPMATTSPIPELPAVIAPAALAHTDQVPELPLALQDARLQPLTKFGSINRLGTRYRLVFAKKKYVFPFATHGGDEGALAAVKAKQSQLSKVFGEANFSQVIKSNRKINLYRDNGDGTCNILMKSKKEQDNIHALKVDTPDLPKFEGYFWRAVYSHGGWRAFTKSGAAHTKTFAAELVLAVNKTQIGMVTHVDGNTLNCRRANLVLPQAPAGAVNKDKVCESLKENVLFDKPGGFV